MAARRVGRPTSELCRFSRRSSFAQDFYLNLVSTLVSTAGTTSYTDATVTGNTTYWYVAQSTCTGVSTCPAGFSGSSANSNEISVVVPASVPLPPANLTGVAQ